MELKSADIDPPLFSALWIWQVFPDAVVVMTSRNPVDVLKSLLPLLAYGLAFLSFPFLVCVCVGGGSMTPLPILLAPCMAMMHCVFWVMPPSMSC